MQNAASRELASRWSDAIGRAAFDEAAPWLRELRDSAVSAFAAGGLPHRKVEAWKYTPMRLLEARAPELPAEPVEPGPVEAPPALVNDAPRILLADGAPVAVDGSLPDGVRLLTLREALERHEEPIREMAQRLKDGDTSFFKESGT